MSAAKKLSDRFLIGEELGRGAYGQVYKGIDYVSGDTVAIKQISLAGIAPDNLQSVMGEIDLLKTLNHKNIVKYIGSFKTRSHLYIILEFMENGSLASIIKPNKFGTFPESLVAVYIAQVLQGLQYLHEQGVVHRDIKGANILTTKDGLVKLADFGVAAKLGELEDRRDDLAAQPVVGTPYWMAPEVIEMTQVTSSSDIWSVGCLIVELLTGYPPYFDLNAMSAMFRIVQDPMPPLPEDITPLLRDFLSRCFLKDAKLRPDAGTLLQHEWLQHNRRTLRSSWRRDPNQTFRTLVQTRAPAKQFADAHETINSVVSRMMAAADEDDASSRAGGSDGAHANGLISRPSGPLGAGAVAQADGQVAGGAGGDGGVGGSGKSGEDMKTALLAECPPPSSSLHYSTQVAPGVGTTLPYAPADGEAGPSGVRVQSVTSPALSDAASRRHGTSGSGTAAAAGVAGGAAVHAGDAAALPTGAVAVGAVHQAPHGGAVVQPAPLMSLIQRLQGEEPLLQQQQQQQQPQRMLGADGAVGGSGRPLVRDLAAWTEGGGQAYDMMRMPSRRVVGLSGCLPGEAGGLFEGSFVIGHLETESMGSSLTTQATELRRTVRDLVRNMRLAGRHDVRDNNRDIAAMKDTPARAANSLEQLISGATPSAQSGQDGLAGMQYPPAEVKALFLGEGGVLVLMELLDTDNQKAVEAALDLLAALVRDDVRLLESLCLVGIVPAVARFTQQPWQASLRLKAASFVHALCFQRDSTLQLFIAAGGLKQLCWMVADSVASEPSPLSYVAIQCLLQVLQCYVTLPLNYICRILAQCGLVPRLYKLLKEAILKRKQMAPSQAAAAAAAAAATNAAAARGAAAPAGGPVAADGAAGASPPPPATNATGAANGVAGGPHHGRSMSSAAALPGTSVPATDVLPNSVRGVPGGGGVDGAAAGQQRAMTLPANGTAAAERGHASVGIPGSSLTYEQVSYLLDRTVYLLVVMSNADGAVKSAMCTHDNLLQHLDCLVRLQPPHLVEMLRCLRNLTSDPAVMTSIKDAGAIACLVPMLAAFPVGGAANATGAAAGPASAGAGGAAAAALSTTPNPLNSSVVQPKSEVQMEALNVLYNVCMYDKKTHVEAAASSGIVPHLCTFAAHGWAAHSIVRGQRQAGSAGNSNNTAAGASATAPSGSQTPREGQAPAGAADPSDMSPGSQAAIAAAAAQWTTVRGFVVPLLIAMVTCSSATRNKLYGSYGLEIFLQLLSDEDSRSVLGVLQALDSWLAEDHSRVEVRLTQRDAVGHMVQLYGRSCAAQDMQSKLETLRTMLGRSSKLAVALAMGGLVPWLLAMIQHAAPINRVKILDIVRILYEHYPRPKEFIMMYKIQDVLAMLLKTHGRDADAVIQQAQRLLSAFDINVLL